MEKKLIPLTIAAVCSLLFFTIVIFFKGNYEFLFYLFVVLLLMFIVYRAQPKIQLPLFVLWHLLIWAVLHLAGGNLSWQGTRLYDHILIDLVGEPYHIFKFDQLIHIYGFFAATLVAYYLLKPLLKENHQRWISLGVIVIMAGLGFGALNEIVEFMVTVIVKSTGVGSYVNNALDLVANFLGAVIAFVYIKLKKN